MRSEILFDNGEHRWVVLGRDNEKNKDIIDTNEYVIIHGEQAVLLDPGGIDIFPQVLTEITKFIKIENIKSIVVSHQDPDVGSSISMWADLNSKINIYCATIWKTFLMHFGMGTDLDLLCIPDEGMELPIGDTNAMIYFVPAHYCHSSGNFSCYDPISRILFSGDIGAALLLDGDTNMFVDDFDMHIKFMEGFHRRWMPSKEKLNQWINRVRMINPDIIAPQHGSLFRGDNVGKFLNWLEQLEVGKWNSFQEETDISKCIWLKWKK